MQRHTILIFLAFIPMLIIRPVVYGAGNGIERVSVSSSGVQGNNYSSASSISGDGRFVAFSSFASNLVPGDTNDETDAFVHDRHTGETERVGVSSFGVQGGNGSSNPLISANGRFVAFVSRSSNLVPGDTNRRLDVFVNDRETGATERVSVSSSGEQGSHFSSSHSISADGRFVAFISLSSNLVPGDTNWKDDVFLHDRNTGVTERISVSSSGIQGNDYSSKPSISADGRFVVFNSNASNLVPGDTNYRGDVFVHDRNTGATERVSVSSSGVQSNEYNYFGSSISADGRFVAFSTNASSLVPEDTNNEADIFVHDRNTGVTERISVSSSGVQANIYSGSYYPSISADGRFVTFASYASNLVPDDTNDEEDVFIHDRITGITERVSVSSTGVQGNNYSYGSSISTDGRVVAFASKASNLVPGDSNDEWDVFVVDLDAPGGNVLDYFADINPAHCPNRISTGVSDGQTVTIALAGQPGLSVWKIKAHTIRLENQYRPVSFHRRDKILDHDRQNTNDPNACLVSGVDGVKDLIIKFDKADVLNAMRSKLGRALEVNDVVELNLTGVLRDGTAIEASDFLQVRVVVN